MSGQAQAEASRPNPLEPTTPLIPEPVRGNTESLIHPQAEVAPEDSAVTKAEKFERHAAADDFEESSAKRVKLDIGDDLDGSEQTATRRERQKGVAPIKAELVFAPKNSLGLELISM